MHKGLERFFYDADKRGIQTQNTQRIADILDRLDSATLIKDMNYPGSNLHKLSGELVGSWSVKVSGNWRITFQFTEGNAYNVNYVDYH